MMQAKKTSTFFPTYPSVRIVAPLAAAAFAAILGGCAVDAPLLATDGSGATSPLAARTPALLQLPDGFSIQNELGVNAAYVRSRMTQRDGRSVRHFGEDAQGAYPPVQEKSLAKYSRVILGRTALDECVVQDFFAATGGARSAPFLTSPQTCGALSANGEGSRRWFTYREDGSFDRIVLRDLQPGLVVHNFEYQVAPDAPMAQMAADAPEEDDAPAPPAEQAANAAAATAPDAPASAASAAGDAADAALDAASAAEKAHDEAEEKSGEQAHETAPAPQSEEPQTAAGSSAGVQTLTRIDFSHPTRIVYTRQQRAVLALDAQGALAYAPESEAPIQSWVLEVDSADGSEVFTHAVHGRSVVVTAFAGGQAQYQERVGASGSARRRSAEELAGDAAFAAEELPGIRAAIDAAQKEIDFFKSDQVLR